MLAKRTGAIFSKEVLVVLWWTLSSLTVLAYPGYTNDNILMITTAVSVVSFPVSGVLADVFFSRYKVVRYSLRLLFATTVAYNLLLVINNYIHLAHLQVFKVIIGIFNSVALSGTLANVLALGVDQLVDASSSQLSTYISWNAWIFFLVNCFLTNLCKCWCMTYVDAETLWTLVLPFLSTISLVCDILWSHLLVKEPVTSNSLKLIYQVLRYAVKNKYPRMRSAFTYWEDKPYSRIDLGKSKYGGPFTTEQVEDVKTFFRFSLVVVAGALTAFVVGVNTLFSFYHEMFHYRDRHFINECHKSSASYYLSNCFERLAVGRVFTMVPLLFIPLKEMLFLPIIAKLKLCRIEVSILQKFLFGLLLLAATTLLSLGSEVASLVQLKNSSVICILYATEKDLRDGHVIERDYKWLICPRVLFGFSVYILYASIIEFITAQAPYAMRGLLIGITFYACMLSYPTGFFILHYIIAQVVSINSRYCSLWFYCILVFLLLLVIVFAFIVKKCYTPRRRDEDLHNRQMFAENYYDKYLENKLPP